MGPDLLEARMAVCAELWKAGVAAEFVFAAAPKAKKQIDHALETGIPFLVWIGEVRLQSVCVRLWKTVLVC